jgi:two-component system sensor histidine kinase KdpD
VLDFARSHNITKIIVGKPLRSRWQELLRASVVDQLIRRSGNIDVYVISGQAQENVKAEVRSWVPHHPWRRYVEALLLVASAGVVSEIIAPYISPTNLIMLFLLAVVIAAVYLGRGPAIVASFFGVLTFDFFFVPPFLTFAVSDTEYVLTFFGLFIVGVVISQLASRVREQADAARQREAETAILYSLSRDLAVASEQEDIAQAIISNVSETFGRQVALLLADSKTGLMPYETSSGFNLDENEIAVATWAFEHGQTAGRGTDTLPSAKARYLPLRTARGVLGVMGIGPGDPNHYLTPEQRRLLDAFASLAALAIERAQLADAARDAQLLEATEKLQTALLNSISHDLRTPLVSITGALTSLQEDGAHLDETLRNSMIENARGEAERLNRLVGNLLDMTRLESGALTMNREPVEIEDIVGAALEQLNGRLGTRPVQVDVPRDLPLVPLDFGLLVQVLVNLIDNAIKYSAADSPIEVSAQANQNFLEIQIADRGVGIPPDDLARVFDKFYRVQHPDSVGGTGLGLSISKGFVEAHGGSIQAENRPDGGTLIRITLPRLTVSLSKRVSRQEQVGG